MLPSYTYAFVAYYYSRATFVVQGGRDLKYISLSETRLGRVLLISYSVSI